MPRELSAKDIQLLRILAPECEGTTCGSSGIRFRSVLPPVAQHFASDEDDFRARIARLDNSDLEYLIGCIRNRSESLGCIRPAYVRIFVELVAERLGFGTAEEVIEVYVETGECDDGPLP
jgi:hypothetical protein